MKNNRQAVLLIHGIGEQRPMDTLRGFVKAVWETDKKVQHKYAKPGTWSIPDTISDNYELRCLTTSKNKNDVLTDFYEFYWAHLMEGNKISHVTAWLKRILFKAPWKLPKPLVGIWCFLVISGLAILYFLFNQALPDDAQIGLAKSWYSNVIGLVLIPIVMSIFQDIVGDAARYLDPSPKNIKRRQEIRAKGVNMIKKMHDSGKYDRIIVVGHSLGTFIAYDILTHAWQHYNKGIKKTTTKKNLPELLEMETLLVAWGKYKLKESEESRRQIKLLKLWPIIEEEMKESLLLRIKDILKSLVNIEKSLIDSVIDVKKINELLNSEEEKKGTSDKDFEFLELEQLIELLQDWDENIKNEQSNMEALLKDWRVIIGHTSKNKERNKNGSKNLEQKSEKVKNVIKTWQSYKDGTSRNKETNKIENDSLEEINEKLKNLTKAWQDYKDYTSIDSEIIRIEEINDLIIPWYSYYRDIHEMNKMEVFLKAWQSYKDGTSKNLSLIHI